MKRTHTLLKVTLLGAALAIGQQAGAAVSVEEAAKLKTELTPFGAERAGSPDGTIPAWEGGYMDAIAGLDSDGRRADPFAKEKPLYSVNAENMDQYADKLSDGVQALMKKYPDFRIDVYPTHRTGAAPEWVYENTFKNATRAKLVEGSEGLRPDGAYGGIPFPIPQSGLEAIWNHELRWRPPVQKWDRFSGLTLTADGRHVQLVEASNEQLMPYYLRDGEEKFKGNFWMVRSMNSGPPIRAGEGIVGRLMLDEGKNATWVYLTGQRRVRKLPNNCCDTPTPFSAGTVSFDEVGVFGSSKDRYDWKLIGKQELIIPYNSNRTLVPTKYSEVLGEHFLNPDHVRWELHRVWVVEATLKEGQRHTSPRSRYYLDEDTWMAVLADRWDANDQLWRMPFSIPITAPEVPVTFDLTWGVYNLLSGSAFINVLMNESPSQVKVLSKPYPETLFTPDGLIGAGLR